jgi:hypothetical protein
MKQVSHIFLKDVRRFWPEIVTSIALLAAFGWNAMRSWLLPEELVGVAGGWFEYKFLPGAVYVALPVAWAFLILRVVQAESLVGDRQFWITPALRMECSVGGEVDVCVGFYQSSNARFAGCAASASRLPS